MNISDAIELVRELTKVKRPTSKAHRDELMEEWSGTAEQLKEFAEELTGLIETVDERVNEFEDAERADWGDLTQNLRDGAQEVIDALT